jgi:hypothetical protein
MATYKVIQDIEAEDKLIGPLTLRQFIYAGVAILFAYLSFFSVIKHAGILVIFFLPITGVAGFLCWPWSLNQPTEVWALSKIRFILKPHRRIWDQSGAKQLVTITAPKKNEITRTNGLTQTEVKSRLRALADVIDSRGWAIKNVNLNLYSQPLPLSTIDSSDRLINIVSLPQAVPNVDVQPSDDILDDNNPVAQHFQQMIASTSTSHRDQIVQQLQATINKQQNSSAPSQPIPQIDANIQPTDYWFINNATPANIPAGNTMFDEQLVSPSPGETKASTIGGPVDENILIQQRASKLPEPVFAHMRTITVPLPSAKQTKTTPAKPSMTPQQDPAILGFVGNNDLNVATIERLANQKQSKQQPPDEVVVSLH